MTQIYEQATSIIAWLGKPENENNNRLAFSMMKDFNDRYRRVRTKGRPYRPWWLPHRPRSDGEDVADFVLAVSPAKDKSVFDVPGSRTHKAWLGVIALWKSPWWTRMWVYQESTIPERYETTWVAGVTVLPLSSKVRFLCGEQETNWSELNATNIVASNVLSTPGVDSRFLVGAQKSVDRLITFRLQRIQQAPRSSLETLQMFRYTECLDPRDKVYAPLCLAPDDVRRYIKPNYTSKTVLDTYMDVARYYLAQPGHELDFLGHALYQGGSQEVETPDGIKFSMSQKTWTENASHFTTRGTPSNKEAQIPAYHPLEATPSSVFIKDDMFCISGVCIDDLKDIIRNTGADLDTIRTMGREKGRKWATDSQHKYFTGETFGDAIQRTAVLDLVYDEQGRPSERGNKLDSAFLRRPRADLSLFEYRSQMNMRIASTKASTLRDMGFSQKRFLLMVPNTAVVGDMIWALAGGQVLYLLRSVNRETKQYRFLGECYVHGMMDGDIMRRLHLGEVWMEDIKLI